VGARPQRQREIQPELLQGQQKWAAAVAAADRAYGLLPGGTANEPLRELAEHRLTELTLAAELDRIFTDAMVELADRLWSTLGDPGIDKRYAAAFRDAGIDVQRLSVERAADRIRRCSTRAEIAAALDHWTAIRAYSTGKGKGLWKKLQELATAVDPDPFRVKLRKVWADWDDPQHLLASPELLDQPMPVIMSLALTGFVNEEGKWLGVLRALHRRHPQDFWVNFELGSDPSHPVDAVRFSTAAVVLRPENVGPRVRLGEALRRLGRFDDAMEAFQEASRLRKDSPVPHFAIGKTFAAQGRWDEAVPAFREAIRLAPTATDFGASDVATAQESLGMVLLMQGKVDGAIRAFQQSVKIYPLAEAYYGLSHALVLKGNWVEALAAGQHALKLSPKNPALHNGLAWLWATCPEVKYRDPARAVASARRALDLAPGNGDFLNTLGVAHYRNGDWKAAVDALTKSVRLRQGGDSFEFFFLAMAHRQLNEKDKARAWYGRAVAWMDQHKPQDEELKRFRAEATQLLGRPGSSSRVSGPRPDPRGRGPGAGGAFAPGRARGTAAGFGARRISGAACGVLHRSGTGVFGFAAGGRRTGLAPGPGFTHRLIGVSSSSGPAGPGTRPARRGPRPSRRLEVGRPGPRR
jgi:tetratricopeptide (TPR) repeat protein